MMKSIILGAAVATGVAKTTWTDLANPAFEYSFATWKAEHGAKNGGKFLGSEEAFNANVAEIRKWNSEAHSYKKGVNQFSALTKEQFKHKVIGSGRDKTKPLFGAPPQKADLTKHVPVAALPTSVDWRTQGAVTPVKDQGGCGGCWAFSAAETAESAVFLAAGKLLTFSEQEILACTPNPDSCGGTGGCSGATQELAFAYIGQAGITTEAQWPYTARSGTCDWTGKTPVANFTGYVALPFNNYSALINSVVSVGPIAISGAAEPWQSYETGVFDTCTGSSGSDVDHAIVLEGYGTDSVSGDYWLVRNSWSAGWGEKGYIRLQRYGDGKEPCTTDKTPGDGDGCAGGPASIKVCGECGIMSDSSYPTGAYLL